MQSLSPEQFSQRHPCPDLVLIDVRSPAEFRAEHIPGSINLPLDQLDEAAIARQCGEGQTVCLVCKSGQRAAVAAERLATKTPAPGKFALTRLEGGINALAECNVALNRASGGVISLERQVRIAAGGLVLLGVLIGSALHPAGFALSALVGAGLVVAGVTDWCGMGLLLARLPWNAR